MLDAGRRGVWRLAFGVRKNDHGTARSKNEALTSKVDRYIISIMDLPVYRFRRQFAR